MHQLRLIEIKTGNVVGWVIGKTPNNELVIQAGIRNFTIKVNSETNTLYRVELFEASVK